MKQKGDQIRGFTAKEIESRRNPPLDDGVAKYGSSSSMLVLTSFGLEPGGELLGRDLDIAGWLVLAAIGVVTIVDHLEKVIESLIIIKHAKEGIITSDGILIIKILITRTGPSIIIKKKTKDAEEDPRALARLHAPPAITQLPSQRCGIVAIRR